ncbi:Asp/Glu/hydantoin racemase [Sesbania bispinosa]|nr:Asp/Glu/hydantoin racemase [Sesbania bispinosa]
MSLSYPSKTLLGCVTTPSPRFLCKSRSWQVQATPPSSVVLDADESGKFSKKLHGSNLASSGRGDSATPFVSQGSKVVGIIGGMSVDATLNFLRKLVELSSEDGQDSIPFVICSDPVLNKELLSYERSYFVSSMSKGKKLKLGSSQIVQSLRNKRAFLENSGTRCIVMPCNVSHSWYEQVSKGCSVPFLHMAECVAKELKEAKLKPLEAGSPLRIGVLATNATLAAGFYKEKLQNEGFEVILPDRATMEHTVIPAIEALNRKDMEGACNLLRIALQVLLVRAVNSVILASDEMRDLLPHDDPLLKKCIDPMDALARSTIKWVRSSGDNT